jgi:hypothetical protein
MRLAVAASSSAGADTFPPDEPIGSFPAPPSPFAPDKAVEAFNPIGCIFGPSPYPFFVAADTAVQLATTVDQAITDVVAAIPSLVAIGYIPSFPDPVKDVVETIEFAAKVVAETVTYARSVAEDCGRVNEDGYIENIDSSTVNLWQLENQNEATMAAIESSVNTIHQQVHVVQQTVNDQLTINIRRALSQPTTAPKNVDYELPAAYGGNLDSTPIGVQAVVTSAFNAARSAGLPINATASTDLANANSALANHNYKTAWADYQLAYQALR